MIEFALTAHGLYLRLHVPADTLALLLIVARLCQRLL